MPTELVPLTTQRQALRLAGLRARFPFVYVRTLTHTRTGRPVLALQLGQGRTKVLLTAAHHANEHITASVCWTLLEEYCAALETDGLFGDVHAARLYHNATLYIVPMLNPEGADLVAGAIPSNAPEYRAAQELAARYPQFPFPQGWKANLSGVDLNLNYPAAWRQAKRVKAQLGFTTPAPRDFPGAHPLDQPETAALAAYACCVHPDIALALHTQGGEIYHGFHGFTPPGSLLLAEAFAACSGYAVRDVPPQSDHAGFKDWFVTRFRRPAFTIEAGYGENPLPLTQLPSILRAIRPILVHTLLQ